jgi:hypothetical protein
MPPADVTVSIAKITTITYLVENTLVNLSEVSDKAKGLKVLENRQIVKAKHFPC